MDNYNATLKALRNSIHTTRINQGDCDLAYELEMWTKILDGVIANNGRDNCRCMQEASRTTVAQSRSARDHFSDYNRAEVSAIKERE